MIELQRPRRASGDGLVPVAAKAVASRAPARRAVDASRMDILPAVAALDDAGPMLQVPGAGGLALARDRVRAMRDVASLGVRHEHWLMTPGEGTDGLRARIERVDAAGEFALVQCRLAGMDGAAVTVKTAWPGADALPRGLRVRLEVRPWDLVLLDALGRPLPGA